MKVIDVFSCYYAAKGKFNGVARHGAVVKLTATSDSGNISYDYSVSFFPYDDPEDFRISYDAEFSKTAYSARRDSICPIAGDHHLNYGFMIMLRKKLSGGGILSRCRAAGFQKLRSSLHGGLSV